MLELARPEARVQSAQSDRLAWGIVDVILAVLMLPFGLAFFMIETIVDGFLAPFSD
jgi:hypothetical protein